MTRFLKLGPDYKVINFKTITRTDTEKCPHKIFAPEHYRDDGTCKCNDESELVMAEWGYIWKKGQWR